MHHNPACGKNVLVTIKMSKAQLHKQLSKSNQISQLGFEHGGRAVSEEQQGWIDG